MNIIYYFKYKIQVLKMDLFLILYIIITNPNSIYKFYKINAYIFYKQNLNYNLECHMDLKLLIKILYNFHK